MFFNDIHIRIRFALIVVFICFLLIIGKVFYIQVISYNKLSYTEPENSIVSCNTTPIWLLREC